MGHGHRRRGQVPRPSRVCPETSHRSRSRISMGRHRRLAFGSGIGCGRACCLVLHSYICRVFCASGRVRIGTSRRRCGCHIGRPLGAGGHAEEHAQHKGCEDCKPQSTVRGHCISFYRSGCEHQVTTSNRQICPFEMSYRLTVIRGMALWGLGKVLASRKILW